MRGADGAAALTVGLDCSQIVRSHTKSPSSLQEVRSPVRERVLCQRSVFAWPGVSYWTATTAVAGHASVHVMPSGAKSLDALPFNVPAARR